MDKRKVWREEEQQVVERWNAAEANYRELHAKMQSELDAAASDELKRQLERARADIESVRRQVARLKVAYISGKRY